MTLPHDRLGAIRLTHRFLEQLVRGQLASRVPAEVRDYAASLLKHFPAPGELIRREELAWLGRPQPAELDD